MPALNSVSGSAAGENEPKAALFLVISLLAMRSMNPTLGKAVLDNCACFTDEKTEAQGGGPDVPRITLWSVVAQLFLEVPVTEPVTEVLVPLEGLMEVPDPGVAHRGRSPSWTHLQGPVSQDWSPLAQAGAGEEQEWGPLRLGGAWAQVSGQA